jgi:NADPH:quinone reductase-like Zn-dependent oxidoreductase
MNRQFRALVLSLSGRRRFTFLLVKQRAADLERLAELIEAGSLLPSVDRTYPLDQTPKAMQQLEDGQVRGKIAITI